MAAKDPMLLQLGNYLRQVREQRGWSQEELAFECDLHRTYIGAVERGEYNVTLLTLRKITDKLGISLADAIGSISGRRGKRR
jgi:transcriptional regulator with XRE-family HTH domain